MTSSIRQRLILAILTTAVFPLVAAITIAHNLVNNVSLQLHNPKVGYALDQALNLYVDLATSIKTSMRYQADAIAAQEGLRAAALLHHQPSIDQELTEIFPRHANLVRLAVADENGNVIVEKQRRSKIDEATELTLEVRRPLSDNPDGPTLLAVFTTAKARFDQRDDMASTVQLYRQIEASRKQVVRAHLYTYAILLAATVLASILLASRLAAGVGRRVTELSNATQAVGAGDLTVRVPVKGSDELAHLAAAFNRMMAEINRSRARIEFLQRMGSWQEMARRLAHEIKNPLTPIQLAIEEVHARYRGDDKAFHDLLDTALGVVTEEVTTLRRLVTEFSEFARLPRAQLSEQDLCAFLRGMQQHHSFSYDDDARDCASDMASDMASDTANDKTLQTIGTENASDLPQYYASEGHPITLTWKIPPGSLPLMLDRQMMRRVLVNLIRNAAQAIQQTQRPGNIVVSLQPVDNDWVKLHVDDDGPGVPESLRDSMFDPYVTTKPDGTGLGLSIVKKIVMEHGGSIEVSENEPYGARIVVWLPRLGSSPSLAAAAMFPVQ